MSNCRQHRKMLYGMCLIIISVVFLFPQINYQPYLAQGDHGRDLYAASASIQGQIPYIDYWWVYGPLMPYYYGLFQFMLGATAISVLIGKTLLIILSTLLIYLVLATIVSVPFSLIGGLWFLVFGPEFLITFNHTGGVTLTLAVLYCSLLYLNNQKNKYAAWGAIFSFLLCLVKINFGLISFGILIFSILLSNKLYNKSFSYKEKILYIFGFIALIAGVFGIYFALTSKLPIYEIRQCLPYLASDHPHNQSVLKTSVSFLKSIYFSISENRINLSFAFLIWLCLGYVSIHFYNKKFRSSCLKKIIATFLILFCFYGLNLHEYLLSGVVYRAIWAKSFNFLFIFFIIGLAAADLNRFIRIFLLGSLLCMVCFFGYQKFQQVETVKTKYQFLNFKRGQIFTGNSPQWTNTVTQTTLYLQEHVRSNETFFAMPYDVLYYYLTGQKSPTRHLIFFDHINIPPEQEKSIIAELEKNHVNWVVLSNRMSSQEKGLGRFGVTYCPIIAQYLENNFELAAQYGAWGYSPQWIENHGTRILKRK